MTDQIKETSLRDSSLYAAVAPATGKPSKALELQFILSWMVGPQGRVDKGFCIGTIYIIWALLESLYTHVFHSRGTKHLYTCM